MFIVITFAGEWWGKLDIKFYGKKEDYEFIGKEHALVLPNHLSDIDWMVGWIICERTGILGVSNCFKQSWKKKASMRALIAGNLEKTITTCLLFTFNQSINQ